MNRFNRLIRCPNKIYRAKFCRGCVIINKLRVLSIALISRAIRWYYHCDIPYTVDVSGVYFCHKGFGVVINPQAQFGQGVVIQHRVTIGEIGKGIPVIGDNVYIGACATILGGIIIGNNSKIGAGAVVITDVPEGCTAVGVPAKIIKTTNE